MKENKFNTKIIKKLAEDIMIELNEYELTTILTSIKNGNIVDGFSYLEKINTDGVESLHFTNQEQTTFLREDDQTQQLEQSLVLDNAKETLDDYIIIRQGDK